MAASSLHRPAHILFIILGILCLLNLSFYGFAQKRRVARQKNSKLFDIAVSGMGLTDLCVATEARYTRHPAVTDKMAPFMDHPGAIEHFPTGSFWAPPPFFTRTGQR